MARPPCTTMRATSRAGADVRAELLGGRGQRADQRAHATLRGGAGTEATGRPADLVVQHQEGGARRARTLEEVRDAARAEGALKPSSANHSSSKSATGIGRTRSSSTISARPSPRSRSPMPQRGRGGRRAGC